MPSSKCNKNNASFKNLTTPPWRDLWGGTYSGWAIWDIQNYWCHIWMCYPGFTYTQRVVARPSDARWRAIWWLHCNRLMLVKQIGKTMSFRNWELPVQGGGCNRVQNLAFNFGRDVRRLKSQVSLSLNPGYNPNPHPNQPQPTPTPNPNPKVNGATQWKWTCHKEWNSTKFYYQTMSH